MLDFLRLHLHLAEWSYFWDLSLLWLHYPSRVNILVSISNKNSAKKVVPGPNALNKSRVHEVNRSQWRFWQTISSIWLERDLNWTTPWHPFNHQEIFPHPPEKEGTSPVEFNDEILKAAKNTLGYKLPQSYYYWTPPKPKWWHPWNLLLRAWSKKTIFGLLKAFSIGSENTNCMDPTQTKAVNSGLIKDIHIGLVIAHALRMVKTW